MFLCLRILSDSVYEVGQLCLIVLMGVTLFRSPVGSSSVTPMLTQGRCSNSVSMCATCTLLLWLGYDWCGLWCAGLCCGMAGCEAQPQLLQR